VAKKQTPPHVGSPENPSPSPRPKPEPIKTIAKNFLIMIFPFQNWGTMDRATIPMRMADIKRTQTKTLVLVLYVPYMGNLHEELRFDNY